MGEDEKRSPELKIKMLPKWFGNNAGELKTQKLPCQLGSLADTKYVLPLRPSEQMMWKSSDEFEELPNSS